MPLTDVAHDQTSPAGAASVDSNVSKTVFTPHPLAGARQQVIFMPVRLPSPGAGNLHPERALPCLHDSRMAPPKLLQHGLTGTA